MTPNEKKIEILTLMQISEMNGQSIYLNHKCDCTTRQFRDEYQQFTNTDSAKMLDVNVEQHKTYVIYLHYMYLSLSLLKLIMVK